MLQPSWMANLVQLQWSLMDQMPDAVIVLDRHGQIAYWNRGAERLFHIPPRDAVGRLLRDANCSPWLTPEDEQAAERAVANKEVWRGETVRANGNGHAMYVESSITALTEANGEPAGSLVMMRDVTTAKRKEFDQDRCIEALRSELSRLKALDGLIPICSTCKCIRDEGGVWREMETYIGARLHIKFSHGICPTCVQKLHPDFLRGWATP